MRSLLAGFLMYVLAACSCDDGPPTPPDGPSAAWQAICDAHARATCGRADRCPEETPWYYRTAPQGCVAAATAACLDHEQSAGASRGDDDDAVVTFFDYVERGLVRFHQDRLGPCVDAIVAADCQEADFGCLDMFEDHYEDYFAGTVPVGGACPDSVVCADAGWCKLPPDSCGGTCQPPVPAGGSCALNERCAPGAYCDFREERCVAYARQDDPCGSGGPPCGPGLDCVEGTCRPESATPGGGLGSECTHRCARGLACHENRCVRPAFVGEACGPELPCEPASSCVDGTCKGDPRTGEACALSESRDPCIDSYCQRDLGSRSGVCAPVRPIAEGKACDSYPVCAEGLLCSRAPGVADTACLRRGALGEPCASDRPCEEGLYCRSTPDGGACAQLVAPGGDCSGGAECVAHHTCNGATCEPAPGEGGSCSGHCDCAPGFWCDGSVCRAQVATGAACEGGERSPCFQEECAGTARCRFRDGHGRVCGERCFETLH